MIRLADWTPDDFKTVPNPDGTPVAIREFGTRDGWGFVLVTVARGVWTVTIGRFTDDDCREYRRTFDARERAFAYAERVLNDDRYFTRKFND